MICSINILISPEEAGVQWDKRKLIAKFGEPTKWEKGKKPLFRLDNFLVFGWENELKIVGSLAKYHNGNNIENLDWRNVPKALTRLSNQLGIPLRNGRISRLDVAASFEVINDVAEYLPEMFYLEHYQRIHKKRTTLRFENNSHRFNYCFYDKKKEILSKKLIPDTEYYLVSKIENLMRIELQIQDRISLFLKKKDVRVSDLYCMDFCKQIMYRWFRTYQNIEKKAILIMPREMKGSRDFDHYRRRCDIQTNGWDEFDYVLDMAFKHKSLSSIKSKKKKQYKDAMRDNRSFPLQYHTLELEHKVKLMCCEALKQFYAPNVNFAS